MSTHAGTVSKGARVSGDDVAKGVKESALRAGTGLRRNAENVLDRALEHGDKGETFREGAKIQGAFRLDSTGRLLEALGVGAGRKQALRGLAGAHTPELLVAGGATVAGHSQRHEKRKLQRKLAAVEKGVLRQGTLPVLARVRPAAGRGSKRAITGDRENNARIIGKADVSKLGVGGFKALGRQASQGAKSGLGGWKNNVGGGTGMRTADRVGRLGGQAAGLAQANPGKAGLVAGGTVTAGVMAGNGQPSVPRYTPPQMYQPYGGMAKRSYDPEDERRFRQGTYAGASLLGGGAALESARRGVKRDTAAAQLRGQSVRGLYPVKPPTHDSGLGWPKAKSQEEKAQRALGRQQAYEKESELYARHKKTVSRLKSPEKLKGHVVTGRQAGKAGLGLAGIGLSGALLRSRREERWD